MDPDAAQQAAQQAANCQSNETLLDMPKFYGTTKDTVTEDNHIERIDASVNALAWTQGMAFNFLYDTGASRTCMTMNTFRNAFPNGTPRKLRANSISDELYDAGGKSLGCIGVYEMDFEVHGRRIKQPVRVLQHVTEDIMELTSSTHTIYGTIQCTVKFF